MTLRELTDWHTYEAVRNREAQHYCEDRLRTEGVKGKAVQYKALRMARDSFYNLAELHSAAVQLLTRGMQ